VKTKTENPSVFALSQELLVSSFLRKQESSVLLDSGSRFPCPE